MPWADPHKHRQINATVLSMSSYFSVPERARLCVNYFSHPGRVQANIKARRNSQVASLLDQCLDVFVELLFKSPELAMVGRTSTGKTAAWKSVLLTHLSVAFPGTNNKKKNLVPNGFYPDSLIQYSHQLSDMHVLFRSKSIFVSVRMRWLSEDTHFGLLNVFWTGGLHLNITFFSTALKLEKDDR